MEKKDNNMNEETFQLDLDQLENVSGGLDSQNYEHPSGPVFDQLPDNRPIEVTFLDKNNEIKGTPGGNGF